MGSRYLSSWVRFLPVSVVSGVVLGVALCGVQLVGDVLERQLVARRSAPARTRHHHHDSSVGASAIPTT